MLYDVDFDFPNGWFILPKKKVQKQPLIKSLCLIQNRLRKNKQILTDK